MKLYSHSFNEVNRVLLQYIFITANERNENELNEMKLKHFITSLIAVKFLWRKI